MKKALVIVFLVHLTLLSLAGISPVQEDSLNSGRSAKKYGVNITPYGESYLVNLSDIQGIRSIALYDSTNMEVRRWTSWDDVVEIKSPDSTGTFVLKMIFIHGVETQDKLIFE